jgi:predicted AAA+ superfamily ATPase
LNIRNLNDLISHPALCNSWEGYVIEQIIREFDDEFEYYFYRTQDGTECDLVLVRSNKPFCAVEMKFTSSPKRTKSLTTAIADLETRHNFVIVPQINQPYPLDEKIWVTDLPGFIDSIRKIS